MLADGQRIHFPDGGITFGPSTEIFATSVSPCKQFLAMCLIQPTQTLLYVMRLFAEHDETTSTHFVLPCKTTRIKWNSNSRLIACALIDGSIFTCVSGKSGTGLLLTEPAPLKYVELEWMESVDNKDHFIVGILDSEMGARVWRCGASIPCASIESFSSYTIHENSVLMTLGQCKETNDFGASNAASSLVTIYQLSKEGVMEVASTKMKGVGFMDRIALLTKFIADISVYQILVWSSFAANSYILQVHQAAGTKKSSFSVSEISGRIFKQHENYLIMSDNLKSGFCSMSIWAIDDVCGVRQIYQISLKAEDLPEAKLYKGINSILFSPMDEPELIRKILTQPLQADLSPNQRYLSILLQSGLILIDLDTNRTNIYELLETPCNARWVSEEMIIVWLGASASTKAILFETKNTQPEIFVHPKEYDMNDCIVVGEKRFLITGPKVICEMVVSE